MATNGESSSLLPDKPHNIQPLSLFQAQEISNLLASAITTGNIEQAKQIASRLASERVKVKIDVDEDSIGRSANETFSLTVHVEDRECGTSLTLKVTASDTINELKHKLMLKYQFPVSVQKWIIEKKMPPDNETLGQHKIKGPGYTVYVYLLLAKSVNLTPALYQQQKSISGSSINSNIKYTPTDLPTGDYVPMMSATPTRGQLQTSAYLQQSNQSNKSESTVNDSIAKISVGPNISSVAHLTASNTSLSNHYEPVNSAVNGTLNASSTSHTIGSVLKTSAANKSVGWVCKACTYINFPTRPGCEICSSNRPDDYRIPDGYVLTEEEKLRKRLEEEHERKMEQVKEDDKSRRLVELLHTDDIDLVSNSAPFNCPICFDTIAIDDGVVLRDCLHMFCRECLMGAAQHTAGAVLICPYQDEEYTCESVMQEREIRALVNDQIYQQILQRSLTTAESQETNSYHCATTDCHGWCIYEDLVNFFLCPVCKKENCLTCKAVHQGQNCREYQNDINIKAANDSAMHQTKDYLDLMLDQGNAMHCPQCKIIIMKKEGCDWIKCSCCKTEICWVTKGRRWGPNGDGDITGGCRCNVNGKRCHANCNNCH